MAVTHDKSVTVTHDRYIIRILFVLNMSNNKAFYALLLLILTSMQVK